MLKNTKQKLCFILLTILPLFSNGCFKVASQQAQKNKNAKSSGEYGAPQVVGKIDNQKITESSGIAASPCQSGILWTHNDSGNDAEIFAIDATGKTLATFRVNGAQNIDWEDIAAFKDRGGECFLFIGDIGDNDLDRSELAAYRVREPQINAQIEAETNQIQNGIQDSQMTELRKKAQLNGEIPASSGKVFETETAEAIKFDYSDGRHDAETLMVNPQTGDIYIVSKILSGSAAIYKLEASRTTNKINHLEKIGDISVPAVPNGLITGGDIAPDGKRAVLCDYYGAYEFVLPKNSKNFDDIWKAEPSTIELGERRQGEAVGYAADGKAIFATSEKAGSPLIKVKRK